MPPAVALTASSVKAQLAINVNLRNQLDRSAKDMPAWDEETFGVVYTVSGITTALNRQGFAYTTPKLVPGEVRTSGREGIFSLSTKVRQTTTAGTMSSISWTRLIRSTIRCSTAAGSCAARTARCEDNDVTASMIEGYRPAGFYRYYKHLPVQRGDHVLNDLGVDNVAILKVDVERGEVEVLQGFYNSLEMHRPPVIFEILPNRLLTTVQALDDKTRAFREQRNGEIEVLFGTLNYQFYAIQADGSILKVEQLKAPNQVNSDYLAVPNELNEKLAKIIRFSISG